MKLPLGVLDHLLERVGQSAYPTVLDDGRWHGHRIFFVDGSGCSMPDTPVLQDEFSQPGEQQPGCGFPVARLLALFHAGTGLLTQRVVSPLNTHELSRVQQIHPAMEPGEVGSWGALEQKTGLRHAPLTVYRDKVAITR